MAKGITSRKDDYSQWYNDIVLKAELADYSPVKGCMVIRPNGYELWENMQRNLDGMIKRLGHRNAYFPLFIPESFLNKEKEHVEGFAPECAVVTHGGGKKLEEPLMVRPTSETVMYHMYSKWIKSYRDLPLLLNQWANVVRWEMRTRLFLRTTEFLWQEGHTAHATAEEAEEETLKILDMYADFAEEYMAIPVIKGLKTDAEKFAGAVRTYCIEALMQDGKALQAGTSHNLGQNFAEAFDVRYQTKSGDWEFCWQTSWGVSTRLIGALIMVHSDDKGMVMPPKLAPTHVVIVPIWKTDEEKAKIMEAVGKIQKSIDSRFIVRIDDREKMSPGAKFFKWELEGVPVRMEIGPRDLEKEQVVLVRRDSGEKTFEPINSLAVKIPELLDNIQKSLYKKALNFREEKTSSADSYDEFKTILTDKTGFILSHWCGNPECEASIQTETKATIRLIPLENKIVEKGKCIKCGKDSEERVYFAKSY